MNERLQLFMEAKRKGRELPVPIRSAICTDGAREIIDFNNLGALLCRDMAQIQQDLDKAVENGGLVPANNGAIASIVYWDGEDGLVAGYAPDSGINVAYGHIHHSPRQEWDEIQTQIPTYTDEYVVASAFTGLGICGAMAELLSGTAAMNTTGIGARFLTTIAAQTTEYRTAVEKLLARFGAVRQVSGGVVRYQTIVLQPEMYPVIGNQQPPFVESTVRSINETTRYYQDSSGSVYVR